MRGCTRIIRKARGPLRIDNRDIDARIGERCIDRRRCQRSLGRCDLTICACIRRVAASAGNIAEGEVTTCTEQEKQEQEDHPHLQYPSRRFFLWPRICRRGLRTLERRLISLLTRRLVVDWVCLLFLRIRRLRVRRYLSLGGSGSVFARRRSAALAKNHVFR